MKYRPIILYLVVYALFLAAMHFRYGFGVVEPLLVLLVFGLGLSLLALWTTRSAQPRNIPVKQPRQESAALAGYRVIYDCGRVTIFDRQGLEGAACECYRHG